MHNLADRAGGRITVAQLDINEPARFAALRRPPVQRRLDVLFVNAGTTNNELRSADDGPGLPEGLRATGRRPGADRVWPTSPT